MKTFNQIVKYFWSNVFAKYLLIFLIIIALFFGALYLSVDISGNDVVSIEETSTEKYLPNIESLADVNKLNVKYQKKIEELPAEISDDFLPVTKREIIEWEGRVHKYMTYGRRVFKNLDENSNYKYFIVEPHDYMEDGADKYSPVTRSLREDERVKIVGAIAHYCWWNEEEYDGCVPWVDAENMEVINRDE